MSIETIISEALLESCRVTGRGLPSLLAFWRAYQKVIPAQAKIDEAQSQRIEDMKKWLLLPPSITYPPSPNTKDKQMRELELEAAAVERRRQLWKDILSILEMSEEDAVLALGDLINSEALNLEDLRPFIFSFGSVDRRMNDPVYKEYRHSVYIPFVRVVTN